MIDFYNPYFIIAIFGQLFSIYGTNKIHKKYFLTEKTLENIIKFKNKLTKVDKNRLNQYDLIGFISFALVTYILFFKK